jgi:hypothetical protein
MIDVHGHSPTDWRHHDTQQSRGNRLYLPTVGSAKCVVQSSAQRGDVQCSVQCESRAVQWSVTAIDSSR